MEKWNSKITRNSSDTDLLAAVNVAVKAGRVAMDRKAGYRESSLPIAKSFNSTARKGVKLYEITMFDHHGAFGIDLSQVSFVPLQLSNPGECASST